MTRLLFISRSIINSRLSGNIAARSLEDLRKELSGSLSISEPRDDLDRDASLRDSRRQQTTPPARRCDAEADRLASISRAA
jgi:hypothetical protein